MSIHPTNGIRGYYIGLLCYAMDERKRSSGSEVAKLYQAIAQSKQGFSRTQCSNVSKNQKSKAELDLLIDQLFSHNKIERRVQGAGKERCEFYKAVGESEN